MTSSGRPEPSSINFGVRHPIRRGSHGKLDHLSAKLLAIADGYQLDEFSLNNRTFVVHVQRTLDSLAAQEDTDGNMQITIDDNGPKARNTTTRTTWIVTKFIPGHSSWYSGIEWV